MVGCNDNWDGFGWELDGCGMGGQFGCFVVVDGFCG